jgi:hypothetical protein
MMMRGSMILLTGLLVASAAQAAPPGTDPDWPCRQRLVPALTATTFWSGPPLPDKADWQANPKLAAEIAAVAPRDVAVDDAVASLTHFAGTLKPAARKTELPLLFLGIVEETNQQRSAIVDRIKELAKRQRGVGDTVAKITAELQAIPDTAEGDDAQKRAEIVQRRDFVIRTFQETERTMRYACDVPVELEARLGSFAKALEAKL